MNIGHYSRGGGEGGSQQSVVHPYWAQAQAAQGQSHSAHHYTQPGATGGVMPPANAYGIASQGVLHFPHGHPQQPPSYLPGQHAFMGGAEYGTPGLPPQYPSPRNAFDSLMGRPPHGDSTSPRGR
jgi:hypothetical protein